MTDLCIHISTINGTGSYSSNAILTRMIFRAGWPVGTYNFFPSNIAGLPCTYTLRLNSKGHTSYKSLGDLLIHLNPKTFLDNLKQLKPSGCLITDEKDSLFLNLSKFNGIHIPLPFTKSITTFKSTTAKTKKFLKNMIYVGLISKWLNLNEDVSEKVLEDFFSNKNKEVLKQNKEAFQLGIEMAGSHPLPYSLNTPPPVKKDSILMDGNEAVALGALFSGCQFLSWYPITPASSLADSFEKWANAEQRDKEGGNKFIVHQTEDEISALGQTLGAGWTGLRAMTVTSGPGLSLMSEGAGLSYFAEVPSVLCNVQRAGPSTGLPTRTQQSDLISSCFLSHGSTKHVVLLPGNLQESFSFIQKAFNLSDYLQTLVILLTDLDLGMNLRIGSSFKTLEEIHKGKILFKKDLEKQSFYRYEDKDNDGISYRVLPGTNHPKGAYFTRGSGHNEKAEYSEDSEDYKKILDKLNKKWETAKTLVPEPIKEQRHKTPYTFVTFGSNEQACQEAMELLEEKNIFVNFLRVRSYPFHSSVKDFLKLHSCIFVVEQNKDGQLKKLLSLEFPKEGEKMISILKYNGRPFAAEDIVTQFESSEIIQKR